MNPIGLHHIMATGHHYDPACWVSDLQRPEWNPAYYQRPNLSGIGFHRTSTVSNAFAQYKPGAAKLWEDLFACDEKYLLSFHPISWNYTMKSVITLLNERCYQYNNGIDNVRWMQQFWAKQKNKVDAESYRQVVMLLSIQEKEVAWWRNACLLYFQTFSKTDIYIPAGYEQPDHTLEHYEQLKFPLHRGIK